MSTGETGNEMSMSVQSPDATEGFRVGAVGVVNTPVLLPDPLGGGGELGVESSLL